MARREPSTTSLGSRFFWPRSLVNSRKAGFEDALHGTGVVAVVDRAVVEAVEVAADQKSFSKVSVWLQDWRTANHFMKM